MSYISDGELLSRPAAERARRRALRYTWLLGVVFLVGGPGAYFVANTSDASYTAEGSLWIEPSSRQGGNDRTVTEEGRGLGPTAWIELLRSRTVLDPVAEGLSGRLTAEGLSEKLTTAVDRRGNLLQVGLTGSEPKETADVLNAIMEQYVDVAAGLKVAKLEDLMAILEEQLKTGELNYDEAMRAFENFRVESIGTSGDQTGVPAEREIERKRLIRSVEVAEYLYEDLRRRAESARLAAASSIPDVRILDRASVPSRPNRNTRFPLAVGFFLACLAVALGGALVLSRRGTVSAL